MHNPISTPTMKPKVPKPTLRSQFASITNTSSDVANAYLEKYNWNLEEAMHSFFGNLENVSKKHLKPDKALVALFDKYASENPDVILIDGTLAYLEDLGFDPEDPISLTLAYILESPQTGEFHREAFLRVWADLHVSRISEMKAYVEQVREELKTSELFEKFYRYVYEFVRGSDSRIKTIGYEDAILYWQMLFGERPELDKCQNRLQQWYAYVLENQRNISRDLWNMFLKFIWQVIEQDPENLSAYDEMSAWPSMVDEYVEWLAANGM